MINQKKLAELQKNATVTIKEEEEAKKEEKRKTLERLQVEILNTKWPWIRVIKEFYKISHILFLRYSSPFMPPISTSKISKDQCDIIILLFYLKINSFFTKQVLQNTNHISDELSNKKHQK